MSVDVVLRGILLQIIIFSLRTVAEMESSLAPVRRYSPKPMFTGGT